MEVLHYPRLGETLYRQRLHNGLTVMVVPRPGFTKKLAYLATNFGAIHQEFDLDGIHHVVPAGVAHYLEHKLFDMPDRDITAEFTALGAVPNAFTTYDMTAYHFSCTENFYESLQLLLEMVFTPCFTKESVEREQGIIGQEIVMNGDSPESRVFEQLMEGMYTLHPVRKAILGTAESIANITPEILHLCHRAFYRPDNMILCVVGDVEPDKVAALAQTLSGPVGPAVCARRSWPETTGAARAYVSADMEVAMPMFQLGFKCQQEEKGAAAAMQEFIGDLAAEALFGESSPLYQELYQKGLIDSAFGGGFETVEGMAMLTAYGDSWEPETVQRAITQQARLLVRDGIGETDFLRMKRSSLGRRIRGLDSFDSVCFRLCAYYFDGYDYFRFPELYEKIQKTHLQVFLEQVVTERGMCLSVIRPLKEERK